MSRSLDDLDPAFRPLADQLLDKIRRAGIPISIICTRRTQVEQSQALATGVSEVQHSKHQDGLAIDVCPNSLLDKKNWAPADPLWWEIGAIGKGIGLRWGGQWDHPEPPIVGQPPKWFFDPGHFEMVTASTPLTIT